MGFDSNLNSNSEHKRSIITTDGISTDDFLAAETLCKSDFGTYKKIDIDQPENLLFDTSKDELIENCMGFNIPDSSNNLSNSLNLNQSANSNSTVVSNFLEN